MIDSQRLLNAVKGVLLDKDFRKYDFNTIIKQAKLCWDDTAIRVESSDFVMIFDKISYELLSYEGFDVV